MKMVAIKIVYKDDTESIDQAIEEFETAGFTVIFEDDVDCALVDANRSGGHDESFGATRIIVGTRG